MQRETNDIQTRFTATSDSIIRDAFASAYQMGEAKDRQFNHLYEATGLISDLRNAGFEIVRKPQAAQQVQFSVRIGWPVFTSHTVEAPEGSDVATVTRAAKALANAREGGGARRSRWVAFSLVESRFLAPDEPAPDRLVVGPYEDLVGEVRPPEAPEMTGSDRERYERRWETGLRNIVTILHGPRYSFEIGTIVEEVRALAAASPPKPQPGAAPEERVEFARRTGCWDGVSDRDYRTWLASLQQTIVPPADKTVEVPGLMLRDNGILAVFYDDGHNAFGGDAADMVAFRDMAATVVGAPRAAA